MTPPNDEEPDSRDPIEREHEWMAHLEMLYQDAVAMHGSAAGELAAVPLDPRDRVAALAELEAWREDVVHFRSLLLPLAVIELDFYASEECVDACHDLGDHHAHFLLRLRAVFAKARPGEPAAAARSEIADRYGKDCVLGFFHEWPDRPGVLGIDGDDHFTLAAVLCVHPDHVPALLGWADPAPPGPLPTDDDELPF